MLQVLRHTAGRAAGRLSALARTRAHAAGACSVTNTQCAWGQREATLDTSLGMTTRSFLDHIKARKVVPLEEETHTVAEVVNGIIEERPETSTGRDLYTVVYFKGKQHKVTQGDLLITDNIEVGVGADIRLEKILMFGSKVFTAVGAPLLPKEACYVQAKVLEKTRSRRVIVYKMRRRKRYRKKNHMRHIRTVLRIDFIKLNPVLEATDGISTEAERPEGKQKENAPQFDKLQLSMHWNKPNRQQKVTLETLKNPDKLLAELEKSGK